LPDQKEKIKYSSFFTKQALKYWEKSTNKIQNQIDHHIDLIEANPRSGWPLGGEYLGLWASDSGKFRIIYEIYSPNKEIKIIKIGPRGDVYK
jgi:mRNA-degrading endonuclease RelE of RelBE toxin-antitoxin system